MLPIGFYTLGCGRGDPGLVTTITYGQVFRLLKKVDNLLWKNINIFTYEIMQLIS